MLGASTEDLQKLVLTIGGGGVLGYFIANKYNKSKTLGTVIGIGVTLGSLYAFRINIRDIFATKSKNTQLQQNLSVPLTSIDDNTIPDIFTIKSDGYNTTYSKFSASTGSTSNIIYNKISGTTTGFGTGSPTIITYKEFEDAYKEYLKQPK